MFSYTKSFKLKDKFHRTSTDLLLYSTDINAAVDKYNQKCRNTPNKKYIEVDIDHNSLDFKIQSEKVLRPKYIGIALKLFSQILVDEYRFLSLTTNSNPKKLFISA